MSKSVYAVTIKGDSKVPEYKEVKLATPAEDEVEVKVVAAGFSHLVKGRALGLHYSAGGDGERAVGVDGVGYVGDELVYFTTFTPTGGSYGQYVITKKSQVYPFPKGVTSEDAIARVAALSNGLMASVFPLGGRIPQLKKNATVAILGATGTSGQLAIQSAKKIYGAAKVIGIARSTEKLKALQKSQPLLDEIVGLDTEDSEISKLESLATVDVVLDYLWGTPCTRVLDLLIKAKKVSSDPLYWVQIGQISGEASIALLAPHLRSTNLQILGSGIGPLAAPEQRELLIEVVKHLADGTITAPLKSAKLSNVAEEWTSDWDAQTRKYFVVEH